ncbi:MAG: hypothetical protein V7629_19855, partial [Motiliproteus sp.]
MAAMLARWLKNYRNQRLGRKLRLYLRCVLQPRVGIYSDLDFPDYPQTSATMPANLFSRDGIVGLCGS